MIIIASQILHGKKAIFCLIALLILSATVSASFYQNESSSDFSPSPSYIVLNKWAGKNKRKISVTGLEIKEEKTFSTKLANIPFYQTKMIIKTENLRFMLYTKGKKIFDNTDKKHSGYSKQIHIIDISDIKRDSELMLYLVPARNCTGRIYSDILLTSKNDFLLNLISNNKKSIATLIMLFSAFIILLLRGLKKLREKKKTAPKYIYLSACVFCVLLYKLSRCELAGFFIKNADSIYLLQFLTYSLSGIFSISFLASLFRIKNRFIYLNSVLILLYSALRIFLFYAFFIPLFNANIIINILLIASAVIPVISAATVIIKAYKDPMSLI